MTGLGICLYVCLSVFFLDYSSTIFPLHFLSTIFPLHSSLLFSIFIPLYYFPSSFLSTIFPLHFFSLSSFLFCLSLPPYKALVIVSEILTETISSFIAWLYIDWEKWSLRQPIYKNDIMRSPLIEASERGRKRMTWILRMMDRQR